MLSAAIRYLQPAWIHPDAPAGITYDHTEHPIFSLLEVKWPNLNSYSDCPYLKIQNGKPEMKKQHAYY